MIHIFIGGPMETVGGNFNFPLFDHVANRLRATGKCAVFNPAEFARQQIGPIEMIMKMDKKTLSKKRKELIKHELVWICEKADVLLLLPGWRQSRGASAENAVAIALDDVVVRECPNIILYDSPIQEKDVEALLTDRESVVD